MRSELQPLSDLGPATSGPSEILPNIFTATKTEMETIDDLMKPLEVRTARVYHG